eukprot:TRINITY_DN20045_c0_g1_i3.p1 TRINITY_DN20045_c0_g1~~TRINITY_DN20045_c0_g1_i3.p1  ORF type:complete len:360 (-),score=54.68 TRINITY_DN20045_c0_g1_i3:104-1183(-)
MILLKAAFSAPPRADPTRPGSKFALLPQQSEDELAISEVHSKLDRALSFLQRDVGYSLLDDARPQYGGGVTLTRPRAFEDRTISPVVVPAPRGRYPQDRPPEAPEEPASDVLCCSPEIGKYAHYQDDIVLVWRFANMIKLPDEGGAVESKGSDSAASGSHETLYKKVLQGLKLMHLCDYHYADVVLTLAYASVYFRSAFVAIGHKMSDYEAAHVSVLLIYLAHSFLLDETCPLRVWQQHVFKKYCNLKVLDAALFRIFQMRTFKLRITQQEEQQALTRLLGQASICHVRLSSCINAYAASGSSSSSSTSSKQTEKRHVNGTSRRASRSQDSISPCGGSASSSSTTAEAISRGASESSNC